MILEIVTFVNDILWGSGQVLIYLLVAVGLWFSWKLRGIQIIDFSHMLSLLHVQKTHDQSGISSFQALCTSLSARVGTGNLAGVAVAISLGGAGSIFWMWFIAIIGMTTGFAESLLGQVYKVKDSHDEYRGGPAYYITNGLGKPWFATLFAICIFMGYGLVFSAMQANTIADSLNHAYGTNTLISGILITVIAGGIVLGGFKTIARFAAVVTPIMGGIYIIVALTVMLLNFTDIPAMFLNIFASAFGLQEAGAGALGAAIKNGIQRGLYSNEAGSGSVPQAAAAAAPQPNHPASQGYVQMFGVFFDTIILCSCTAFIILLAGGGASGEMEGIRMTQNAMEVHFGTYGVYLVSIMITLFAFTSVVANYAYAESNLRILKLDNKIGRLCYTVAYLCMVLWGANASLREAWGLADMALGLMTVVNVTALFMLTPTIISVCNDYKRKAKAGEAMGFTAKDCDIQGTVDADIWKS